MTARRAGRYSPHAMHGLRQAAAFVVQFTTGTDFTTDRIAGRVEHVASGRTLRFESLAALLEFLTRVLEDVNTQHPDAG